MIIKAKQKDLSKIKEISDNSLKSKHSLNYFKKFLNDFFYVFKEEDIRGFIIIKDNTLILIAVEPESRGQGIGKKLLDFTKGKFSNLKLKVRDSNKKAIEFYSKNNFKKIREIKNHYKNKENAIIMEWLK